MATTANGCTVTVTVTESEHIVSLVGGTADKSTFKVERMTWSIIFFILEKLTWTISLGGNKQHWKKREILCCKWQYEDQSPSWQLKWVTMAVTSLLTSRGWLRHRGLRRDWRLWRKNGSCWTRRQKFCHHDVTFIKKVSLFVFSQEEWKMG